MNTKRNKQNKTNINKKTKKNRYKPSFKILQLGYPLYASKKYKGDELLEYQKKAEKDSNNSCLLDNSSWFGDYDVAKSYETKETKLYRWKTKKRTNLLNINPKNADYFKKIFLNTKTKLIPTIYLSEKQIKTIKYDHPYIKMTTNEKAYYEFCFAFGYIDVKEQVDFMKLIKYLIENNYITMLTREGKSVVTKMNIKINYYQLNHFSIKDNQLNRLSFYHLDKHAMMNLCKCVSKEIAGVYQKNTNSFWFPDFIVYKMNIQEYILFNPHHNLVYDKEIE
jgi:hypothetical protein